MSANGHNRADAWTDLRAAVLTVSDRSSRGERPDEGGPALVHQVIQAGGSVVATAVVPDDVSAIARVLRMWADSGEIDLILTTGGTGLAERDVTPEATLAVIDREVPGLAEAMRSAGRERTAFAMLSRQVVGLRGRVLIVNVPGAPAAAVESFAAIRDVLPHAVKGSGVTAKKSAVVAGLAIEVGLTHNAIDAAILAAAVARQSCGAVVTFEGVVRSPNNGQDVLRLEYEAYESLAVRQLEALAREVAQRHGLAGVAAVHRLGAVRVGEAALVVVAAAAHRQAAFVATQELVDRIKAEVAVWKKEVLADGSHWVGHVELVAEHA